MLRCFLLLLFALLLSRLLFSVAPRPTVPNVLAVPSAFAFACKPMALYACERNSLSRRRCLERFSAATDPQMAGSRRCATSERSSSRSRDAATCMLPLGSGHRSLLRCADTHSGFTALQQKEQSRLHVHACEPPCCCCFQWRSVQKLITLRSHLLDQLPPTSQQT